MNKTKITMTKPSTPTTYILHKQLSSSIDLFDLLEAYYPEKHHTIVRMRNAAYRKLVETGTIKADGTIDGEVAVLYRKLLNTYIPTNWFSCSPNTMIDAVEKLREEIDLIASVEAVNKGMELDLFNVGECVSFPWFPYTETASHHELVGRFIQKLIKDIEDGVDILAKVKSWTQSQVRDIIPGQSRT